MVSGGGGSGSSESQPANASFLNPIGGVLSNLFGVGTKIGQFGGIEQTGPLGTGDGLGFANRAFGQGSFESIADLLRVDNAGIGTAQAALGQSDNLFSSIDSLIQGQFLPALGEGIDTGFRTDIDPIRQQAIRNFTQTTVPQIQEAFAQQTGSFSTDFLNSITGGAADIETNLGAIQAQLDEAAAGRRTSILGQAPGLAEQAGQVGFNIGGAALNLGEQITLDGTPGGRALTLMQILAGLQPTSAIPRGNISDSSSKSGQGSII